ncbi:ABC transporter permease [Rubrivivax sp. A210]|uniref:hypothetical protein n=1 Tax=Rubrivivax sp. A210 TaxID=2772301 RepID=UPI0019195C71|nr:hypothetical protein [Rubrivivax sp. A210]CAD5371043.1 ABC transporter permease [Rubrivivax sp. A210]
MSLRTRMWMEAALSALACLLTFVTLIWPDWIELVFDESPDGGDGSAERMFAIAWLLAAVAFGWLARRDGRRLLPASALR